MSKQDYTAEVGPSWWDVYVLIDEMERDFVGKVSISINRAKPNKSTIGTYVRTTFRTYQSEADGQDTVAKGNWWTKDEYKSITALIYKQLHHCYEWLHRAQNEAESQARF